MFIHVYLENQLRNLIFLLSYVYVINECLDTKMPKSPPLGLRTPPYISWIGARFISCIITNVFFPPFKAVAKRVNVLRRFAILFIQTSSIKQSFEEQGPHLKTGTEHLSFNSFI